MAPKPKNEQYTDEQIEWRATETLRRALNTRYKPQSKLVGKTPRARARRRKSAIAQKGE